MNGSWGGASQRTSIFPRIRFVSLPCCLKGGLGLKVGEQICFLFSISVAPKICSTKDVFCSSCFDHICICIHMYMSKHASYDAKKTCKKEVMPDRQPMM